MKCNEGYAQAVGDGGKATISCSHLVGWDASPDQLIRCLREFTTFSEIVFHLQTHAYKSLTSAVLF